MLENLRHGRDPTEIFTCSNIVIVRKRSRVLEKNSDKHDGQRGP